MTLFNRSVFDKTASGAVNLDLAVYMLVIDLALDNGWKLDKRFAGREVLRHVGRLALSRHVDPALWDACRSCSPQDNLLGDVCRSCRGTGSLLISLVDFQQVVGCQEYEATWRDRIELVSCTLSTWNNMRAVA